MKPAVILIIALGLVACRPLAAAEKQLGVTSLEARANLTEKDFPLAAYFAACQSELEVRRKSGIQEAERINSNQTDAAQARKEWLAFIGAIKNSGTVFYAKGVNEDGDFECYIVIEKGKEVDRFWVLRMSSCKLGRTEYRESHRQ